MAWRSDRHARGRRRIDGSTVGPGALLMGTPEVVAVLHHRGRPATSNLYRSLTGCPLPTLEPEQGLVPGGFGRGRSATALEKACG